MTFNEYESHFAGKRVIDFQQGSEIENPAECIPRVSWDWDNQVEASELLVELLQHPESENLTGIVIGVWGEEMYENPPAAIMEILIGAAPQLPNLTALFMGDMTYEDCEVSWIHQCDLSPLWSAFPKLEHFRVRGTNDLSLGKIELNYLERLTIETGGLPKSVLQEVINAQLPELRTLEIYFGTNHYGWDGTIDDILPLLSTCPFPKVTNLQLRNSEIADQIAIAITQSPILEQIKVLDLSLGTLSDEGANALLNCEAIKKLDKLDLHRHFISDDLMAQLQALPIEVDVSDQESEDPDDRYVAIGE